MIKKCVFICVLLFTGCVERGHSLHAPIETTPISITKVQEGNSSIPTLILTHSTDESLKNNLSGGLILLIGILLFL